MTTPNEKNAGTALIIFTILMVFTMVLHPVGGGFAHLMKVRNMIIITHAIALLSIPFAAVGFWGLSKKLGTDNFFSISAFSFSLFGLIAVMMAASANGLVMPVFIENYKDASPEKIELVKPVLKYSFSVNTAFDYMYTVGFCLAILFWSITMLRTKKLPVWLGYFGIIVSVLAVVFFFSGLAANSLQGFRIFVSGLILWIVSAGVVLVRQSGH